jgi:hypothetical protein
MQPQDQNHRAQIIALENQLHHYEKILDDLMEKNAVLGEVKIIFHEVKLISQRLVELKKNNK